MSRPVPNEFPSADPGAFRIALVGESPGADEVATGRPFAGKSGWLLNQWLAQSGVSRHSCFVGNVCQMKPSATSNDFHLFEWNEARVQEGIAALRADLERFRPNVVVAFGNAAFHLLRHGNVAPPKSKLRNLFMWPSRVGAWRGSLFRASARFDALEAEQLRAAGPRGAITLRSLGGNVSDVASASGWHFSPGRDSTKLASLPGEAGSNPASSINLSPSSLGHSGAAAGGSACADAAPFLATDCGAAEKPSPRPAGPESVAPFSPARPGALNGEAISSSSPLPTGGASLTPASPPVLQTPVAHEHLGAGSDAAFSSLGAAGGGLLAGASARALPLPLTAAGLSAHANAPTSSGAGAGSAAAPFATLKCLATYHPAATFRDPSFTYPLVTDLKRAIAEARSPQLDLPTRAIVWDLSVEEIEGRCEMLRAARSPVGFDIEGGLGGLQCCSFATSPHHAFVIDLMERSWDYSRRMAAIASVLEDPAVPKVLWNAMYERSVLEAVASITLRNYEDGMLAWWERFSELPKGLDFVASVLTREPYWAEGIGWDKRTGLPKVMGERFYTYNGIDSCVTLEIWQHPLIRAVVESRTPVAFSL